MNSSGSTSGRSAIGNAATGSRTGGPAAAGRPAALGITPVDRAPHPALKWLAIGGWSTFAAEWLLILLVLTSFASSRGGQDAVAAPSYTRPVAPAPTPRAAAPAPVAATPPPAGSGPSVLGLNPGGGHTVILLDAIERSGPWLDQAKAKLIEGLSRPGPSGATFSIAVINQDSGRGLINQTLSYGPAAKAALRSAFGPLRVQGTKGLGTGLEAAVKLGADQVVFVTSRNSGWARGVSFLEGKLTVAGQRIRLDVVQVNNEPVPELRDFVTGEAGGQYLLVTPGSL